MPFCFYIAQGLLLLMVLLLLVEMLLLYSRKQGIQASRYSPERLSNGDDNAINIQCTNQYKFRIYVHIIDEIPVQFQIRDFDIADSIPAGATNEYPYTLRPTKRGVYRFNKLHIYARTIIGLISKRYSLAEEKNVPTYPSFIHLQKYALLAFSHQLQYLGMKKIRRIGQTTEFDQIKSYVIGDDMRHINWKASAKQDGLMVNQYQDERAQPVYAVIDAGRVMKMPFNGMSLLDYAINASLAISNIALLKHDRAGLISFSDKVHNIVVADRRNAQLQRIMDNLYHLDTDFKETDFGKLYSFAKMHLNHRSLLLTFTNFETMDALHRQLKYLKALSRSHVVVVIFFKNEMIDTIMNSHAKTVKDINDKAVAEKFDYEKKLIVAELRKYGIHTLLTRPEDLTINTINKYLELKARGIF